MDLVSGLIILIFFILLTPAIDKLDEKSEQELKRLDAECKELQKQYNELVECLNGENKKKITGR